jgi:hypothetical protein
MACSRSLSEFIRDPIPAHAQNNHPRGNDHAKSILVKDNHVNMFRAVSSLTLRFTAESEI